MQGCTWDELGRLNALQAYQILDTPPEREFDDLTQLAAQICQTPIALVSLIDETRQWFKSKVGLDVSETPRSMAFCVHAIQRNVPLVIEDARLDARFASNPLVTGEPYIRFYAGIPLLVPSGYRIGTLCVIDRVPRQLTEAQLQMLQALSRQVVSQLELKRTNMALQASESTLRSFFDSAPLMMGIVELLENDILHISDNAVAAEFFGLMPATMPNRRASEMGVPSAHIREWLAHYREAERTQRPVHFEYSHETGAGQRWLSATVVAIATKPDQPSRFAYLVQDISDRKADETALQESQAEHRTLAERLHSITANAPVCICEVDREGRITFVNRFYAGFSQAQAIGQKITHWLSAAQRQPMQTALDAAFDQRQIQELEYTIANHRSEVYTYVTHIAPIIQADGAVTRAVLIATDITARKQAEEKLQEQAMLLNIATDAIIVRDLENKILFWNEGARRIYGWSTEMALGQNLNDLLQTVQSSQLTRAGQQVMTAGEWQGELRKYTQSGEERVIESRWSLVRNKQGQPTSILSVDTDITDRKQLEAQLFRSQRLESLGTLAGGIAHDLNNMLTPILGIAKLLPDLLPDVDEKTQALLDVLASSTSRGAALVKQVLTFARGVEGQRRTLQVKDLITEVQQLTAHTFPKSITITIDVPDDLWTIVGDATHLHQVLMNLCVNARDAMPEGGKLTILARNIWVDKSLTQVGSEAQAGPYVVIKISDTGVGISAQVLDRIFDPFFTTKKTGQGTGLGLSTVIGIVKSHSGFIHVSSQLGEGTQFEVYLPAASQVEQQEENSTHLARGQGQLILVVDDEAPIRDIAKIVLESHNYRVLSASDGLEALKLYTSHRADIRVILMDMMMPGMDGQTAIRALQAIDSTVKVIATSGLVSHEKLTSTLDLGILAFLPKPYTPEELLTTLREVGL